MKFCPECGEKVIPDKKSDAEDTHESNQTKYYRHYICPKRHKWREDIDYYGGPDLIERE